MFSVIHLVGLPRDYKSKLASDFCVSRPVLTLGLLWLVVKQHSATGGQHEVAVAMVVVIAPISITCYLPDIYIFHRWSSNLP